MFPRLYWIVFTNGIEHRHASVEADDLAHARKRAGNIAQGIVSKRSRDMSDWSQWRIVIETRDEGRTEDPFPEQALAPEEDQGFAAQVNARQPDLEPTNSE